MSMPPGLERVAPEAADIPPQRSLRVPVTTGMGVVIPGKTYLN
jgi:hypothetical protein